MLKLFPINPLILVEVRGQKHMGVFLGCLFMVAPAWASGWVVFNVPEPGARLDIVSMPLVPAPFEKEPTRPLFFHETVSPLWAYPTEAAFVAYPTTTARSLWVAVALERYQIRLLSPYDYPYIATKTFIPLYETPLKKYF
jgi:hypothetical protein